VIHEVPLKPAAVAWEPADPSFSQGKLIACWKRGAKVLAGFSLGAVLLAGCEPDDVPRFSPDGKKIALLLGLDEESYHQAPIPISVVTLADGRRRRYPLPESKTQSSNELARSSFTPNIALDETALENRVSQHEHEAPHIPENLHCRQPRPFRPSHPGRGLAHEEISDRSHRLRLVGK
jgi:hypothetical protein